MSTTAKVLLFCSVAFYAAFPEPKYGPLISVVVIVLIVLMVVDGILAAKKVKSGKE